ncbi:MAG: histidine--tRNA ligase [Acidobacteriota bacterium]|nr:histidine--tRNA ligase [Acidobacteriota bacterium]
MSAPTNTNPARGMRDFLPVEVRKREYVIGIIKEVYEAYGFEPLETPAVENLETLTGKYGEEGNQLIYKILKRGEKLGESFSGEKELSDLALRYDLTVPLARVVANHKSDLPKFFKRYQIQPVWRADRPARGRYREFYQCDVDAIGSSSMVVEAELCAAVSEILERLGFDDFVIRVNHRQVLSQILYAAGILTEKHIDALIALDKLDKIGREGVTKEFFQRGVSQDSAEKMLVFFESLVESNIKDVLGKPPIKKLIELQKQLTQKEEVLIGKKNQADKVSIELADISRELDEEIERLNPAVSEEITNELKRIKKKIVERSEWIPKHVNMSGNLERLQSLGKFLAENIKAGVDDFSGLSDLLEFLRYAEVSYASRRILIDPSLARGLSYYTGAIFEINVPDLAGSLAGGGRYDGLIGMFGKEQIPACGFSLGLERILVVMEERGMFPKELETNSADVLITVWDEESIGESLKLAGELRRQGLRVLVYPEAEKLGKQFKYASQINVSFVCVLGESELAENKVTLKNMETGEQETIEREEAAARVKIHKQNFKSKS